MLPVFAMATSCVENGTRISFSDALTFAKEEYDPCQYYGYVPTYNVKINRLALKNAKLYEKTSQGSLPTITLKNTMDIDFHDLDVEMDPDAVPSLHIKSYYLDYVMNYTSKVNALLGYFDWGFVKKNNSLGIEVTSADNLATIINMAAPILQLIYAKQTDHSQAEEEHAKEAEFFDEPVYQTMNDLTIVTGKKAITAPTFYTSLNLSSPDFLGVGVSVKVKKSFLTLLSTLQVGEANIYADAYANNVGFLSDAQLQINIHDILAVVNSKTASQAAAKLGFDYLIADDLIVDVSFAADYK